MIRSNWSEHIHSNKMNQMMSSYWSLLLWLIDTSSLLLRIDKSNHHKTRNLGKDYYCMLDYF